jgi:hypothetical protein
MMVGAVFRLCVNTHGRREGERCDYRGEQYSDFEIHSQLLGNDWATSVSCSPIDVNAGHVTFA